MNETRNSSIGQLISSYLRMALMLVLSILSILIFAWVAFILLSGIGHGAWF